MDAFADAFRWLTDSANYSGSFGIPARLVEHVLISFQSTALGAALAIPLGMYIGHKRRFEFVAVSVGNIGRALPSFGIIGFLFPLTLSWPGKIGYWATFIAMFLLAIPPVLTNTYIGIKGVDRDIVEAARGMGMTERDVLLRLELPLATPLVVAGVRTAAVNVVATATLWAVAGGGGLGRFIVDGIASGPDGIGRPKLMGGAILVALLAFATELLFGVVERAVAPRLSSRARRRVRGLRPEAQPAP
jgi:osmoprotectant transport system permease protein